jgi:NAD(P)-dependent dehydrogenase (short-subunit alcohol dehydrogenase family)
MSITEIRTPATAPRVGSVTRAATALAPGEFAGRVAFVTGGTRGIGAAIARALAVRGASIAVGYAGDTTRAEEFAADCRTEYVDENVLVTIHKGNIASGDDCRRSVAEVIDQHGRLDILVNNAGITIDKTVAKMTDDDWNRVVAVNLSGAFYLSQAVLAHMIERGTGRIINVSSVIGEMGNIGQANYAASKSGLFGLTKTLAREAAFQLARDGKLGGNNIGITVNTVTPGFVATEMLDHVPEKVLDRIKSQIPLGRLGTPEEIARTVRFLASDVSGYITGQVWGVNGGLDM